MATTNRLKDHWAEQQIFLRRVIAATILMIGMIMIVLVRLGQLQIVEYEYFSAQSQGNRIRIQPLTPTRGLIYDRNGTVLADNLPSYQLELTPEQVPDMAGTLDRLALFGLIDTENIDSIQALIRQQRRFDSIPIRRRLTDVEVAKFAIERPRFPGVDIHARLARNYPYGKAVAHALGYVSGISAADIQTIDKTNYAGTSLIGKISLERHYEQELHGNVGHEEVLVNARGRIMQGLNAESAVPGKDLILTLDIESQLAAHQALAGRRGAVVAIEPGTGEILVFASEPSFDPNAISIGMSRRDYRALQENPDLPLFNRALQGTYPPGSTLKPIIALAALHYETMDSRQSLFCDGDYSLPDSTHRYRDWKQGGHGPMNMHTAIEQSCDVYFYQLAHELGIDRIESFLKRFGLGSKTGIDLAGEKNGLVPGRVWKRGAFEQRGNKIWFPGETVITGIGQGYLLVTPLQLAHAAATIANRGRRFQPTLLRGYSNPASSAVEFIQPIAMDSVGIINDDQWEQIISAMHAVMQGEHGTARAAGADAPFTMAGKSGTAQVFSVAQDKEYDAEEIEERMRDHALFIAFAPLEDPQIAVAVIVENGESGGGTAAPVARIVMDTYLRDLL
ncbi:MAG: penicillin-binding protein 2 [Gammaproteobacteria bacterium]|nr:penicillin-binding protein 2 [Chromatiales bacterium]MDP7297473.1 penicillin-binding protein 2 [Gammaproteobacteria bacterium]